jgi:AcrR family transcriptional regulator
MSRLFQEIVIRDREPQILQAATGIIASEGYGTLTMRARASGMTRGALQVHLRTWEDMLRALAPYIADEYRPERRRSDSQKRG